MKIPTTELAWVRVQPDMKSKILGCVWRHDLDGFIVLCVKWKDLHADKVTWRPVPIVKDGEVEL